MDIETIGIIGGVVAAFAAGAGFLLKDRVKTATPATLSPAAHQVSLVEEEHDHAAGACDTSGWYCTYTTVNGTICRLHKHVHELPIAGSELKLCRCGLEGTGKAWI